MRVLLPVRPRIGNRTPNVLPTIDVGHVVYANTSKATGEAGADGELFAGPSLNFRADKGDHGANSLVNTVKTGFPKLSNEFFQLTEHSQHAHYRQDAGYLTATRE